MSRVVLALFVAMILGSSAHAERTEARPRCTIQLHRESQLLDESIPVSSAVHLLRVFKGKDGEQVSTHQTVPSDKGSGSDLWVHLAVDGDAVVANCGTHVFRATREAGEIFHGYSGVLGRRHVSTGHGLDSHELDLDDPHRSQSLGRQRNFPITSRYEPLCKGRLFVDNLGSEANTYDPASGILSLDLRRINTLQVARCPDRRWWQWSAGEVTCLNAGGQSLSCADPSADTLNVSLCLNRSVFELQCGERKLIVTRGGRKPPITEVGRALSGLGDYYALSLGTDVLAEPRIENLGEVFSNSGGSVPSRRY